MFKLTIYPERVQNLFLDPLLPWEVVFEAAIDAGITGINETTDLIFFKNHPERMHGQFGIPLRESDRGYKELSEEWGRWQESIVTPHLSEQLAWHGRLFIPMGHSNSDINKLEKFIRTHKRTWISSRFRSEVSSLSSVDQEIIAYLLTTWPKLIKNNVLAVMFAIMSELLLDSDKKESKRARFSLSSGKKIMDELKDRSKRMPNGAQCLNFIEGEALISLSPKPAYQMRLGSIRARYHEVGAFRAEKEQLHARSLSLLAAEMRLEKTVGPMHYAKWNGRKGSRKAYKPSPVDFMNRMTLQPGWYFFLSGVVSYHTIFVAVKVTKSSKVFQIIDDNGPKSLMTASKLKTWYNSWFHKGAGSRVWLIYRP